MRLTSSLVIGILLLLGSSITMADAAAGEDLFNRRACTDCHYTQGPAREKSIEDQLAKQGPELWYAGSKFQRPWLESWLQDPKPIRPLEYNSLTKKNPANHVKLETTDASLVADFLMSLTTDVVEAGKIKPKTNPKGKLIFKKKMPCNGCHQYVDRKKVLGGISGPSLTDAGTRLNPDWIYAYLKHPKVFKPVKMMPVFSGLLSDKDMQFVSAFVANFK